MDPFAYWAKLTEGKGSYHPLIAHSADVAAAFRALIRPGSTIAERLSSALDGEALNEGQRAALVYLAALHDLGKVNHGFQSVGIPALRRHGPSPGHVSVVIGSAGDEPLSSALEKVFAPLNLPLDERAEYFVSVICHHGRPHDQGTSRPGLWLPDAATGRKPMAEVLRIAAHARRWAELEAPLARLPSPTPLFTHLLAGTLTLADWLGSTERYFPHDPSAEADPDAYYERVAANAEVIAAGVGLTPRTKPRAPDGYALFAKLWPAIFAGASAHPTSVQDVLAESPLAAAGARYLVEAETGSGKTEAALALYARLRATGLVSGLVFALPTRATAKAMRDRIAGAIQRLYGTEETVSMALAMGGEQATVETSAPRELEPDLYPDPPDVEMAAWATERTKKAFGAEIVVGTVDQVLLAGLAVKHADMRFAALSRHLLIIDEVHAYDRYMTSVLLRVLDAHNEAGGISALMSATLANRVRRDFGGPAEELPSLAEASDRRYPSVCVRCGSDDSWREVDLGPAKRPQKTVEVELLADSEAVLWRAADAARDGARVCVLHNTVARVRRSFDILKATGLVWSPGAAGPAAYHSRYGLADRRFLDDAALRDFGGVNPSRGVILIATQVAEQSLDVDFDLLISDLCPADVLLQRVGRLHRRPKLLRPSGFEFARVIVIAPSDGMEPLIQSDGRGRGMNGWGSVYSDLGVLERTRRFLAEHTRLELPRQNRLTVESVYHPEAEQLLADESDGWRLHIERQVAGVELAHDVHASMMTLRFEETYFANARRYGSGALERAVRTRIGDDRVRIRLPGPLPAWHAPERDPADVFVDVPFRTLAAAIESGEVDPRDPQATVVEEAEAQLRVEVASAGPFLYSAEGWRWN